MLEPGHAVALTVLVALATYIGLTILGWPPMSASQYYKRDSYFSLMQDGNLLLKIHADGTIERGPAFTTTDEMSLVFWDAVERLRRPLGPMGPGAEHEITWE